MPHSLWRAAALALALSSFVDLTVAAPELAIGGTASTQATVGNIYSFTPWAIANEGDAPYFVAANLPSWASFDPLTGTISGVPGAGDVGTSSNVHVRAEASGMSAALADFSITVSGGQRAATVSWSRPDSNVDGSSYDDAKGYVVYVGLEPAQLQAHTYVFDPAQTEVRVDNLPAGRVYFSVRAFNQADQFSEFAAPAERVY